MSQFGSGGLVLTPTVDLTNVRAGFAQIVQESLDAKRAVEGNTITPGIAGSGATTSFGMSPGLRAASGASGAGAWRESAADQLITDRTVFGMGGYIGQEGRGLAMWPSEQSQSQWAIKSYRAAQAVSQRVESSWDASSLAAQKQAEAVSARVDKSWESASLLGQSMDEREIDRAEAKSAVSQFRRARSSQFLEDTGGRFGSEEEESAWATRSFRAARSKIRERENLPWLKESDVVKPEEEEAGGMVGGYMGRMLMRVAAIAAISETIGGANQYYELGSNPMNRQNNLAQAQANLQFVQGLRSGLFTPINLAEGAYQSFNNMAGGNYQTPLHRQEQNVLDIQNNEKDQATWQNIMAADQATGRQITQTNSQSFTSALRADRRSFAAQRSEANQRYQDWIQSGVDTIHSYEEKISHAAATGDTKEVRRLTAEENDFVANQNRQNESQQHSRDVDIDIANSDRDRTIRRIRRSNAGLGARAELQFGRAGEQEFQAGLEQAADDADKETMPDILEHNSQERVAHQAMINEEVGRRQVGTAGLNMRLGRDYLGADLLGIGEQRREARQQARNPKELAAVNAQYEAEAALRVQQEHDIDARNDLALSGEKRSLQDTIAHPRIPLYGQIDNILTAGEENILGFAQRGKTAEAEAARTNLGLQLTATEKRWASSFQGESFGFGGYGKAGLLMAPNTSEDPAMIFSKFAQAQKEAKNYTPDTASLLKLDPETWAKLLKTITDAIAGAITN